MAEAIWLLAATILFALIGWGVADPWVVFWVWLSSFMWLFAIKSTSGKL